MFASIRRGARRILTLLAIGLGCIIFAKLPAWAGLTGGLMPILAPLLFGFGMVVNGVAVGEIVVRLIQPGVDSQHMALSAERNRDSGSGLAYLGTCILRAVILLLMVTSARAESPPQAAQTLLPVLKAEQVAHWHAMPLPSALGAQVEQETCPSLKHRMCWNPRAELRTSREQGIGLGQLTRAFRADGSTRFDAMAEIVASFPRELDGLSWDNRYDPVLQLRALVLKDLQNFNRVRNAATPQDRLAFTFAGYNGGEGGVRSDRIACEATDGCDSSRWFGHVEHTSLKAHSAVPGYGKSFFDVNREYVRNVLTVRRPRYLVLET